MKTSLHGGDLVAKGRPGLAALDGHDCPLRLPGIRRPGRLRTSLGEGRYRLRSAQHCVGQWGDENPPPPAPLQLDLFALQAGC